MYQVPSLSPVLATAMPSVHTLSTGIRTCAITSTGQLACLARGGTLEIMDPGTDWVALSVSWTQGCAVKQAGTLHCFGDNRTGLLADPPGFGDLPLTRVGTDSDVEDVASGGFLICTRRKSGVLRCLSGTPTVHDWNL